MPLVQPLQIQVEDVYHHRQVNEVALFGRELTDAEYGHLAGICIDGVVLRVVFDVELGGARARYVSMHAEKMSSHQTCSFNPALSSWTQSSWASNSARRTWGGRSSFIRQELLLRSIL